MPITPERQNIEELRAAGFSEAQAILLAAKFEATAQAVVDAFRDVLVAELDKRFGELDKRFGELDKRLGQMEVKMAQMEARFEHSLRVQLATILSAFVGLTTLAVAIIKLF